MQHTHSAITRLRLASEVPRPPSNCEQDPQAAAAVAVAVRTVLRTQVVNMPEYNQLLTASRDGVVRLWQHDSLAPAEPAVLHSSRRWSRWGGGGGGGVRARASSIHYTRAPRVVGCWQCRSTAWEPVCVQLHVCAHPPGVIIDETPGALAPGWDGDGHVRAEGAGQARLLLGHRRRRAAGQRPPAPPRPAPRGARRVLCCAAHDRGPGMMPGTLPGTRECEISPHSGLRFVWPQVPNRWLARGETVSAHTLAMKETRSNVLPRDCDQASTSRHSPSSARTPSPSARKARRRGRTPAGLGATRPVSRLTAAAAGGSSSSSRQQQQ